MNNFWKGFPEKYIEIIQAAEMVALNQYQTHKAHEVKETSIFDKPLTDISLYRKDGKFITPYHLSLLKRRKNNELACPVFDISYKIMIQKEYEKEYKEKVYNNIRLKPKGMELNLMNLPDAYEQFVEEYLKNVFFHQDKTFSFDNENQKVIKNLVAYFTRQQDSEYNIKKGICLYGGVGTGKSTIMRQLSKFTTDNNLKTQFDFVYMDDIYSDCDSNGLESLNNYKFRSCAFDDIGMRAEINVNNYGTKINAYRELVRRQYTRFTRPTPSLSHYTTNIQYNNQDHSTELAKIFGARELDRFREMCNFVPLLGNSRRTY